MKSRSRRGPVNRRRSEREKNQPNTRPRLHQCRVPTGSPCGLPQRSPRARLVVYLKGPHELTFTWWGCCGLPQRSPRAHLHVVGVLWFTLKVPMSSPSRGGDAVVYLEGIDKPAELAHSFLFCFCVYVCLNGPFSCISFHQFSRQLSAFSLCSSGLFFPYWSFQLYISSRKPPPLPRPLSPDIFLCG